MIGGWATIAHGLPRTTLDVDIFVRPTEENVVRLIDALAQVGFGTASELTTSEILERKVYLFSDQIRIDIFTEPWGLGSFDECWRNREEMEFENIRIPFLGLADLIRSKNTDRELDRKDARALREIAERKRGSATES